MAWSLLLDLEFISCWIISHSRLRLSLGSSVFSAHDHFDPEQFMFLLFFVFHAVFDICIQQYTITFKRSYYIQCIVARKLSFYLFHPTMHQPLALGASVL